MSGGQSALSEMETSSSAKKRKADNGGKEAPVPEAAVSAQKPSPLSVLPYQSLVKAMVPCCFGRTWLTAPGDPRTECFLAYNFDCFDENKTFHVLSSRGRLVRLCTQDRRRLQAICTGCGGCIAVGDRYRRFDVREKELYPRAANGSQCVCLCLNCGTQEPLHTHAEQLAWLKGQQSKFAPDTPDETFSAKEALRLACLREFKAAAGDDDPVVSRECMMSIGKAFSCKPASVIVQFTSALVVPDDCKKKGKAAVAMHLLKLAVVASACTPNFIHPSFVLSDK